MTPDRPFEEIKADMQKAIDETDKEEAHLDADDLLCEIAKCSHLVTSERYELVEMWKQVNKWYA